MSSIVYLSHFLGANSPVYGGELGRIEFKSKKSLKCGDSCETHRVAFDNHVGTHVDFPSHFCQGGKTSSDYPPSFWNFTRVCLLEGQPASLLGRIAEIPQDTELLLLKTGFECWREQDKYWADQPVFPPELARGLRERCPDLRVFGFDMISVSSFKDRETGRRAHREFLCVENILLLEDMKLSPLNSNVRSVVVAPLLLEGLDGAPCTVIAYV